MKFVQLTNLDNKPILINIEKIQTVEERKTDTYGLVLELRMVDGLRLSVKKDTMESFTNKLLKLD